MQKYDFKIKLDGDWDLYIEENRNCKAYSDMIRTSTDLEKFGIKKINGSVPGNFELDMKRMGLAPDFYFDTNTLEAIRYENRHLWYVRKFNYNEKNTGDEYFLFEGVDTVADYYLNGEKIGSSDNMLISHKIRASTLICGTNEVLVHIIPSAIAARNRHFDAGVSVHLPYSPAGLPLRKSASMFGWDIAPRIVSGGIWKSVFLCRNKKECINDTYLYVRCKKELVQENRISLYYSVNVDGDFITEYSLNIKGKCGEHFFESNYTLWHTEGMFADISVAGYKLWWPKNLGEPNLYDVTVTLMHGDNICDTKTFSFGIRTVELLKSDYIDENNNGEFKFLVNDVPFFAMGTNWVPLDAFPSQSEKRLPKALTLLEESGCNMIRCWGGGIYPEEELYDFCDRNGIVIWQDFAMGCASYPQDDEFCKKIAEEAFSIVRKYRQHASLFLWAGDNECDTFKRDHRDPNKNCLTRTVIPNVLEQTDPCRVYLPSSQFVSEKAYKCNKIYDLPEEHLWGTRRYYKADEYKHSNCRFASEMGYQGCPSVESIKKFIAPENLWPWQGNDAWIVHASSMVTDLSGEYAYRIGLMASQINVLFGDTVPQNLQDFSIASQISQAEALKYFIEMFRCGKWKERTGIIWWNLLDVWPQFSDAVIDYYYDKKIAFNVIKKCQKPICVMISDKYDDRLELYAANENMQAAHIRYRVTDIETSKEIISGEKDIQENDSTLLEILPQITQKRMLLIEYGFADFTENNYFLTGSATYNFDDVVRWYKKVGLIV